MTDIVSDPYSQLAADLEAILTTEFHEEGFPIRHDRLHESLGYNGTVIGISPESESPGKRNKTYQEITILVQFYGKYNLEIDNEQRVDPRKVTKLAERFRRAVDTYNRGTFVGTSAVWFFDVDSLTYPKDPTGNKSRFECILCGYGNNSALVETAG